MPEAPARLVGVDAARGLALIGMMAVHVLPGQDADGSVTAMHQIARGRSAATFAVLAGVGLALATRRLRRSTGPDYWPAAVSVSMRAVLIAAIGLAVGAMESGIAVILAYYGVLFLLAVPLLRLPAWPLAILAVVVAFAVPAVSHAVRVDDALPFNGANPTFAMLIESPMLLLETLALRGYYPALAWLAYLCAGLAVGQLRLADRRVAAAVLGVGVVLAVAAPLASRALLDAGGRREIVATSTPEQVTALLERHDQFGNTPTTTWWWLAVEAPHASTPPDLIHTTGVALGVLGALLLLATVVQRGVLAPIAAAGSMTLTLYTAHLLLLASEWLPEDKETSFVSQVLVALVFAWTWRRYVGRGPIEQLVGMASGAAAGATGARLT